MPTTNDVVNQHLKCFGERDLEGVLADYSPDAVLFIPGGPGRERLLLDDHLDRATKEAMNAYVRLSLGIRRN